MKKLRKLNYLNRPIPFPVSFNAMRTICLLNRVILLFSLLILSQSFFAFLNLETAKLIINISGWFIAPSFGMALWWIAHLVSTQDKKIDLNHGVKIGVREIKLGTKFCPFYIKALAFVIIISSLCSLCYQLIILGLVMPENSESAISVEQISLFGSLSSILFAFSMPFLESSKNLLYNN